MGSTESKTEQIIEGYRMDVARRPTYSYTTRFGQNSLQNSSDKSLQRINSILSGIKVCRSDAITLENTLRWEHFQYWQEACEIIDYRGYSTLELDSLITDMSKVLDKNWILKLNGIRFCEDLEVRKFEFILGNCLSTGNLKFGTVVMTKIGDFVNTVCCVYYLNFSVAPEVVSMKTKTYCLGIETKTETKSWRNPRSLGFVTQQSLVNFCRLKALDEFHKQGIVSSINDVSSITDDEK
ncbi:hypothetical protein DPMN_067129 [Dreissena polymorpha]|uniref:Uncharacterized protein n=1 Tax=Dreissena polymorpha TaxID=45954 RepID=A0A9D4BVL4_DREPO|nr:hypothetical protein DPMN_067129 [Dreissena polymorpha]